MVPRRRRRLLELSVVVVVCNMAREAPRTLYSLSTAYQRHIDPDGYEVIIIDNGSSPALDPAVLEGLAGHFRLIRIDAASPSPAGAVNIGLAAARGGVIGVMIDGARIATPGLLHFGHAGTRLYDRAVVATLGWYLGADLQSWAIRAGYDKTREDALLEAIEWRDDGYRLFEVATPDESSTDGWFAPLAESNALFMRRELWDELGGLEERFDKPGGGFLNLDTFGRAMDLPGAELVVLLGEATMHQVHGGVATNAPIENYAANQAMWSRQYEELRGHPFTLGTPRRQPTYLGTLPREVLLRLIRAALDPARHDEMGASPLGGHLDPELWSMEPSAPPADPVIAALVALAQNEFLAHRHQAAVAVSRLIRTRFPDEPESQRLLGLIGRWPDPEPSADTQLALREAHRLLGDGPAA
jgi:hypothetical protein